jgi:hypothetical protein
LITALMSIKAIFVNGEPAASAAVDDLAGAEN